MGLLSLLTKRLGKKETRGLLSAAAEEVTRLPNAAREIGPGGLPIRPRQEFRQSLVGGDDDLMAAARMGRRDQPGTGPIGAPMQGLKPNERFVQSGADPNGGLTYEIVRPDLWRFQSSWLPEGERGRGNGIAAYEAVIRSAGENGVPFVESSWARSADSTNIYQALKRRGYQVTEAPAEEPGKTVFRVSTGGALPMDEASRMARAREMGFDVDTPLYHGTDNAFENFDRPTYLTQEPRTANVYTSPHRDGGNIRPVVARGKMKPVSYDEIQHAGYDPAIVSRYKREGYDGLIEVGGDPRNPERLIFDPSNIRSRFAAFDPNKKDSSDLLAAALLGVGLGGGGLLSRARAQRET